MAASHPLRMHLSRGTLPGRLAAAALILATAACATSSGAPLAVTAVPPLPESEQDRATFTGEIVADVSGGVRGAAYGPWRIQGSGVDLTYAGDNAWTGDITGRHVRLVVTPGKIEGAGVNLYLTHEGQTVTIRGTFAQRQISITMTPDSIRGKMASNAPGFEFKRDAPSQWSGKWGMSPKVITLTTKGDAVQYPAVLTPQFYLALIGALL